MEKVKVAIIGPGNIGTDLMYKVMKSKIIELSKLDNMDKFEIVTKMKSIVTEYISNNSEYESLDVKEFTE